jgi:glutathione-regulated potassium-efflux system ancillary protein KefF
MALLVYAHPYPDRSRANRALMDAVSDLPGVLVHSLYDLYPGFDIDVAREQELLSEHELVIWQHPMYWYSVPALLKHWFDKVLVRGWAYGPGANALRDKRCLWACTTGGDSSAFSSTGMHSFGFESFVPAIEQTARFCGMRWQAPTIVHAAHRVSPSELTRAAQEYRYKLERLLGETRKHARPVDGVMP